jgi:hypothetical protein
VLFPFTFVTEEYLARRHKKQPPVYCTIHDIPIPLPLDDSYSVVDFEKAMNYYPEFIHLSKLDWSFSRYMSAIMVELNKALPRDIYKGNTAFIEWLRVYGSDHYRALRDKKYK